MDDFVNLLTLCMLMFVLTYSIGYLPMIFKLSSHKLELISIFGAGFLLGTAFIVIVPEGLSVLMESSGILQANHDEHDHDNMHLLANNVEQEIYRQLNEDIDIKNIDADINIHVLQDDDTRRTLQHEQEHHHHQHHGHIHNHNEPVILVEDANDINDIDSVDDDDYNDNGAEHHHHTHTHDPVVHSVFRKMGCLICFGFIFMMAVEKFSAHSHSHSHSYHHKDRDTECKELIERDKKHSHPGHGHSHSQSSASSDNITSFMVGLLSHSAVDGIALGAVSNEGSAHSLSLLVFVALMAHKAPAAISMTAFLKRKLKNANSQNIKKTIIKQLLLFSCAAPIFAILTYLVLSCIAFLFKYNVNDMDEEEQKESSQMLGYCLLFSGGTFLYVVTLHIIPEIKEWRNSKETEKEKESESDLHETHNHDSHGSLAWIDLLILTIGCVVPSLFEHSH